jgi:hypothetical protein
MPIIPAGPMMAPTRVGPPDRRYGLFTDVLGNSYAFDPISLSQLLST